MDPQRASVDTITGWLRERAIPAPGSARHIDGATQQRLQDIVRKARVVGLGESTHGTHEFFALKHRLAQFLVEDMGFTLFAMECSHAAGHAINAWVRDGTGDRDAALAAQPYLAWQTDEFVALLDWMRAHNDLVPDARKVSFLGVDVMVHAAGRRDVLAYLRRVAPDMTPRTEALFRDLAGEEAKWPMRLDVETEEVNRRTVPLLRDLLEAMENQRETFIERSSGDEFERMTMLVDVMIQWGTGGVLSRSRHMGENLVRLMERAGDGSKAIYWAHNFHVGIETFPDKAPTCGHILRQRFGDDYFALALEFGEGSYQSREMLPEMAMGNLRTGSIGPPDEASLPWYLSRAGLDGAIVDLRSTPGDPATQRWLGTPLPAHAMGWGYKDPEDEWEPRAPGVAYDGIAFLATSTPSHPTAAALETATRGDAL